MVSVFWDLEILVARYLKFSLSGILCYVFLCSFFLERIHRVNLNRKCFSGYGNSCWQTIFVHCPWWSSSLSSKHCYIITYMKILLFCIYCLCLYIYILLGNEMSSFIPCDSFFPMERFNLIFLFGSVYL